MPQMLAKLLLIISLLLCAAAWASGQGKGFAYSLDDSVKAGDFEVRKVQDLKTSRWHVEILQGQRSLFRSGTGAKVKSDLLLGSFPLLGGDSSNC